MKVIILFYSFFSCLVWDNKKILLNKEGGKKKIDEFGAQNHLLLKELGVTENPFLEDGYRVYRKPTENVFLTDEKSSNYEAKLRSEWLVYKPELFYILSSVNNKTKEQENVFDYNKRKPNEISFGSENVHERFNTKNIILK